MSEKSASEKTGFNQIRRHSGTILFFLLALLANFACVFIAFWLAISLNRLENVPVSLLAQNQADYRPFPAIEFAPIDKSIIYMATADAANLHQTQTPSQSNEAPVNESTPQGIVPLPPTPTATPAANRPPLTRTPNTAATKTAVPRSTDEPDTDTPQPTLTHTATPSPSSTNTPRPSVTHTSSPTRTPRPT
ncbi:MAG: hypothetical protein CSB13_00235, partial [Chloroflexi bacterium]